ncbi:MAG: M23 family metallopeptidase, partial [Bacteroidota bacterium]
EVNRNGILLALGLFTTGWAVQGQPDPKRYWSSPRDGQLSLTATFGEIRNEHFHSGIDLSTGGQEGLEVKAAAEGYISRIKVSPDGFGRVLYITHPNGFVTVYAHLKRFREDVQAYTLQNQKDKKSFSIELLPKKDQFPVLRGETIALSGNSGGSRAPHLHFEVRDERTEQPINPLLFGLQVEDHVKPEFRALRVYPLMENGIVEGSDSARSYEIFISDTVYGVGTSEYIKVFGIASVGFDVFDRMEGSDAELGIYSAELYVDNMLAYTWTNDRFDFDDTRFVNAHTDYMVKQRDGMCIQRCQRLSGNNMSLLYPDTGLTGLIDFTGDDSHDLRFIARDFAGNQAEINFQLQAYSSYANTPYLPHSKQEVRISWDKGAAIHKEELDVVIPAGAVYQECYYQDDAVKSDNYLSPIYLIGDRYEALHTPISIGIKPDKPIADSLKSKALVARLELDGKLIASGGTWNKEMLSTKVRKFGSYVITLDTVAPTITKEYYPADLNTSRGGIVQFKVADALSGIQSMETTIDDQWMLAEFDAKDGMLTVDLQGLPLNQLHTVHIVLKDDRNNITDWTDKFWW